MLIWLTGADGWMGYWTVSSQGSSGAEFVITARLLGPPLPPMPSGQEGVGQIQVGVVSLVAPAGLTMQGLLGSRGQVTRETPGVTMAMMEAEQTVVRVQTWHQPGVERGRETMASGEASWPQRSRRCRGRGEG